MNKIDILCIQEHWLYRAEQKIIGELDKNMMYVAKSIDDENPELSMTMMRGYGGVAIMWKKEIDEKVKPIAEGGNRILVLHIEQERKPLCLINVYMPADNKNQDLEYKDTLAQIDEIWEKYKDSHDIILCGDMNGSLHRMNTAHDKILQKYCRERDISIPPSYPNKNTFYHTNGKSKGQIDYIFNTNKEDIIGIDIYAMDSYNTSDHVPVTITLKCRLVKRKEQPLLITTRPKWNSCDHQVYKDTIKEEIDLLLSKSKGDVESDVKEMEKLLHKAGKKAIPKYRIKREIKPRGKGIWNENIAEASKKAKYTHKVWKQHGSPKECNNELKIKMQMAKKLLRKAQRQAYATQRVNLAQTIMSASTNDAKLFHKLVREQRQNKVENTKVLRIDGKTANDHEKMLELWKEHFQKLSTPILEDSFDQEKLCLVHMQNEAIETMERRDGADIDCVTMEEVDTAIQKLKTGKASDQDGISAEHYKYAGEEMKIFIVHIINSILINQDIPTFLKSGILTPVLKKDKDKTNPANYRGITVTKIFAKIIQSILKDRIESQFKPIQNPLQRGFTEGVSSLSAAFLVSEAIAENTEAKNPLILITLDAEKAFDRLNHDILFNKIYHGGIHGKLWILLRNLYRNMSIKVKWEEQFTEDIQILQGIQQGAKLSTTLYKYYNNTILDSISHSDIGTHIGSIGIPAPTCADDIAVLADNRHEAQAILDLINYHTKRDLVKINPDKSDAVYYNSQKNAEYTLKLGNDCIKRSSTTKHLGIKRQDNNKVDIVERVKSGRATIYGLLGAGLHVRKGFSPIVAHNLWRTYAVPRCLYGLEIMNLTKKDQDMLEMAQRKILRQIQGLPPNTASVATYVLLGAEPTDITIDKNLLTFFMNIIRNPGTIEYQIITRQLAMADEHGIKFMDRVRTTLRKYGLLACQEYLKNPPTKTKWKKEIENRINKIWKEQCENIQEGKSTLKYIQIQEKPVGNAHNVWRSVQNNMKDVKAGEVKVRLLTQTYMLQKNRAKYSSNKISPLCILCGRDEEDLDHFILRCPELGYIRSKYLDKIRGYIDEFNKGQYERIENDGNLLQLVMDCTSKTLTLRDKNKLYNRIETMSRNMCYELHIERSRIASSSCAKK